jgi:uncharacterized damage-inducible protein DinB
MKSQINYLYKVNRKENERMWEGIHCLSADQWLEGHDYSLGSIHDHVVHVMYATTRWTYALRGFGKMPPLEPNRFLEIEPAYRRWLVLWKEIDAYVFSLTEEELYTPTYWGLPRRAMEGKAPLWQLLHHLANHALDHRVQVMMLLGSYDGLEDQKFCNCLLHINDGSSFRSA